MKAVIENKEDLYLIRIYGSDGLPCDSYLIDKLEVKTDNGGLVIPANREDMTLVLLLLN